MHLGSYGGYRTLHVVDNARTAAVLPRIPTGPARLRGWTSGASQTTTLNATVSDFVEVEALVPLPLTNFNTITFIACSRAPSQPAGPNQINAYGRPEPSAEAILRATSSG